MSSFVEKNNHNVLLIEFVQVWKMSCRYPQALNDNEAFLLRFANKQAAVEYVYIRFGYLLKDKRSRMAMNWSHDSMEHKQQL